MKKLRAISILLLFFTITAFILWRFFFPLPDWMVRINGIIMLAAVFASVYSTAMLRRIKSKL